MFIRFPTAVLTETKQRNQFIEDNNQLVLPRAKMANPSLVFRNTSMALLTSLLNEDGRVLLKRNRHNY